MQDPDLDQKAIFNTKNIKGKLATYQSHLLACCSDYALEVFFKRHDKNRYANRKRRKNSIGDNLWSRREQVGARKELIEVILYTVYSLLTLLFS